MEGAVDLTLDWNVAAVEGEGSWMAEPVKARRLTERGPARRRQDRVRPAAQRGCRASPTARSIRRCRDWSGRDASPPGWWRHAPARPASTTAPPTAVTP